MGAALQHSSAFTAVGTALIHSIDGHTSGSGNSSSTAKTKVAVRVYNNTLPCLANKKVTVVAKVKQSDNWSQLLTPTMVAYKLGAQRNIHRLKRHQASEYIIATCYLHSMPTSKLKYCLFNYVQ